MWPIIAAIISAAASAAYGEYANDKAQDAADEAALDLRMGYDPDLTDEGKKKPKKPTGSDDGEPAGTGQYGFGKGPKYGYFFEWEDK